MALIKGGIEIPHGSNQRWNRNSGDFFGKTAEEAVNKAVAYIIENKEKTKKLRERVGLE